MNILLISKDSCSVPGSTENHLREPVARLSRRQLTKDSTLGMMLSNFHR